MSSDARRDLARQVKLDLAESHAAFVDGSGFRPARIFVPSKQLAALYLTPSGRDSHRSLKDWIAWAFDVEVIEDAEPDATLRWRAAALPEARA